MGRRSNDMQNKPKGYDRTLELLATLNPVDLKKCVAPTPIDDRPAGTPIKLLVQSFGHSDAEPIRRLITETQVRHRVVIVTYKTAEGMACGIARQHYAKARMLADDYWDRVYGDQEVEGAA